STRALAPSPALAEFVSLLGPGDKIVDLGCGSGRDLKTFKERQLRPFGLDYSFAMCVIARDFSGAPVVNADIRQLPFADCTFEGASAIASLLHFKRDEIPVVLREIARV